MLQKEIGLGEGEIQAISKIIPVLRAAHGGALPTPAQLKRAANDKVQCKSKLAAKRHQVQSLQVQVNDLNSSRWSHKYDSGVAKGKVSGLQLELGKSNRRLDKLQAACREKTQRLKVQAQKLRRLGSRADGRKSIRSLLSSEQVEDIAVDHAIHRVYNEGKYTDIFNNYGPGLLTKYNLSANTTRPVLEDSFKIYITANPFKLKKLRLMHRTGYSRKARARHQILKERNLGIVRKARSIAVCMDGSECKKLGHEVLVQTHTDRAIYPLTHAEFVAAEVIDGISGMSAEVTKSLLSDSTKAGRTGRGQAVHIVQTIGLQTCIDSLSTILFDTTSSNTGEEHGLRAELEDILDKDIMMVLCFLHVWSL